MIISSSISGNISLERYQASDLVEKFLPVGTKWFIIIQQINLVANVQNKYQTIDIKDNRFGRGAGKCVRDTFCSLDKHISFKIKKKL